MIRNFLLKWITGKTVIKFQKLHPDAYTPTKHYANDMAFDLYNYQKITITPKTMKLVKVGIAVECPSYICWTLRSRSSMHINGIWAYPGAGDPGYRGDVGVNVWNTTSRPLIYQAGERIGQIQFMIRPNIILEEADILEDSPRSDNGFGSTGR